MTEYLNAMQGAFNFSPFAALPFILVPVLVVFGFVLVVVIVVNCVKSVKR